MLPAVFHKLGVLWWPSQHFVELSEVLPQIACWYLTTKYWARHFLKLMKVFIFVSHNRTLLVTGHFMIKTLMSRLNVKLFLLTSSISNNGFQQSYKAYLTGQYSDTSETVNYLPLCIMPSYGLQLWHAMCWASEMLGYIPDLFRAARALVLLSAPHNSMYNNACILPPATHHPPQTHTDMHTVWLMTEAVLLLGALHAVNFVGVSSCKMTNKFKVYGASSCKMTNKLKVYGASSCKMTNKFKVYI